MSFFHLKIYKILCVRRSVANRIRDDVIIRWCLRDGRFPDNHFPGQTFPGQDISRIRRFPDKTFPAKTFPGQSLSRTDVSRTICINNFEYFGMFMLQDKRWTVLCTVHVWLYAVVYLFSLHDYFSFIIVSVCVAFIFHLIITKSIYALPILGLHALPNSPRILTAGLHAHISRRSVYINKLTYRVTRPIELVFTHTMYVKIP